MTSSSDPIAVVTELFPEFMWHHYSDSQVRAFIGGAEIFWNHKRNIYHIYRSITLEARRTGGWWENLDLFAAKCIVLHIQNGEPPNGTVAEEVTHEVTAATADGQRQA